MIPVDKINVTAIETSDLDQPTIKRLRVEVTYILESAVDKALLPDSPTDNLHTHERIKHFARCNFLEILYGDILQSVECAYREIAGRPGCYKSNRILSDLSRQIRNLKQ